MALFSSRTPLTKTKASQNSRVRVARREVTTLQKRTYGREAAMEPGKRACVMLQLRITGIGLTACRGDSARRSDHALAEEGYALTAVE